MYTGKINISRRNDAVIVIQVEDALSGTRILSVEMTPEQFGNATTGLFENCVFNAWNFDLLGCRRETKTEIVPDDADLSEWETDGWRGSSRDRSNPHRANGLTAHNVIFARYVRPDGTTV